MTETKLKLKKFFIGNLQELSNTHFILKLNKLQPHNNETNQADITSTSGFMSIIISAGWLGIKVSLIFALLYIGVTRDYLRGMLSVFGMGRYLKRENNTEVP